MERGGNEHSPLLTLLRGRPARRPPAAPIYLGLYLARARRRCLAELCAERLAKSESARLSREQEVELLARSWHAAMESIGAWADWFPAPLAPAQGEPVVIRRVGREIRWQRGDTVDVLTAEVHRPTVMAWDAGPIAPPRARPANELLDAGVFDVAVRLRQIIPAGVETVMHCGTPFWQTVSALGFARAMTAVATEPGAIHERCRAYLNLVTERCAAWKRVGGRVVFIEDGLSSADMLSPEQFAEIALPYLRELTAAIDELGLHAVLYYCGDVRGRLEHLAALRVSALGFEESKKGFRVDLGAVRREVGPGIALWGNLDAVFIEKASREEILEAVREQWESAGPLYAVSPGSPLTLTTPAEKLRWLIECARHLGKGK